MIFDLFHSISDPVVAGQRRGPEKCVRVFLEQAQLAEDLGADTIWCAESHFSSEVQKRTSLAAIPHFAGEVGLNGDSFQLFHLLASHTRRIHFGTAIHNIVGGSGGPIASADRINSLRFINEHFAEQARVLRIGVAAGRFAYQNAPFGIVPRSPAEKVLWPCVRRAIFLEALEIVLRLLRGEALASSDVSSHQVSEAQARAALQSAFDDQCKDLEFPHRLSPRWTFEALELVPAVQPTERLRIVLGSSDKEAVLLARRFWDVDVFQLSFTPPAAIEALHAQLASSCPAWHRSRLPRTVLVFIDPDRQKARRLAHAVLDTYIEAMRGTAEVPEKAVLLERALIGDAAEIRDQLSPGAPRGFHPDDRLMLWFEFNQLDGDAVQNQMRYFFREVAEKI
jgi:alkanesulfonate monooxygenase SsuD/methylene tetrahydromethanopterin reductase-like flavin-dependent oxidoreductase (luciferase family)